jgi:hypothetical protein
MTRHFPIRFPPTALALLLLAAGCAVDAAVGESESHAHGAAADPLAAELREVYRVTEEFVDYGRATAAGFTRITGCDADSAQGAQGYHYAIPARVDGEANLTEPEILMYAPRADGTMRLVGVEYIVPFDVRPASAEPPTLLGQPFMPNTRYEVWALHVWVHQFNPAGVFATWNPLVTCQHARD